MQIYKDRLREGKQVNMLKHEVTNIKSLFSLIVNNLSSPAKGLIGTVLGTWVTGEVVMLLFLLHSSARNTPDP